MIKNKTIGMTMAAIKIPPTSPTAVFSAPVKAQPKLLQPPTVTAPALVIVQEYVGVEHVTLGQVGLPLELEPDCFPSYESEKEPFKL